ncbi:hypothetical protein GLO73106DRAFT_00002860 [Gloeocapsa sp. PCC 73106]|nr:hypothetical protein GLO73106DRAFT_00002860 [Gloeocapsa sp. PCC 73106]
MQFTEILLLNPFSTSMKREVDIKPIQLSIFDLMDRFE